MYEKFEVDKNIPYRLHFGDKVENFVDIKEIFSSDLENILFKDDSPIKKIIQYQSIACLQIEKEHSVWRFWYWDSTPQLKLIVPEIKENMDKYSKNIIYEYGQERKLNVE